MTGEPCPITANEVRQLIASGNVGGTTVDGSSQLGSNAPSSGVAAADEGKGGQADDVDTAAEPELACSVGMAPTCTDPNLNSVFAPDEYGGVIGPLPDTFRFPSRRGWDEFFGYGRLDAYKAVAAAAEGWIPPEANITSPEWFEQMNPADESFAVDGYVNARTPYTCRVEVAPGAQPNNAPASDGGDFSEVSSEYCNGSTVHGAPHEGLLGTVNTQELEAAFPATTSFTGNENGGPGQVAELQRPPEHAARRLHRAGGRLDRPDRRDAGDDRRGSPPVVPAPGLGNAQGPSAGDARRWRCQSAAGGPRRRRPQPAGGGELRRLDPRLPL